MAHLDCQAFFNFLVEPSAGRLRLNAFAGISDAEARKIEWLNGSSICGCAARDGRRIVVEDIQHNLDPRADLVRSYGIRAYCCHPLMSQGRVIGTLSFGTKTRTRFCDDDLALIKTVTDQVAMAVQRVQAQDELRSANQQLLESDRRKNEFLAVLSHELRNPLAPISNSLYVLERAAPGGNQAQRAKEVIERQVGQLTHLVNDLIDVTRISRNKIYLQRQRVDLCDIARRSAEDQRSLFESSEIHLKSAIPDEPVYVNADKTRVAQVVSNLLQNAAKFTGRGGTATIAVAADSARRQVLVRISDTGVGMTPDTLAGLFQPFMQADKTLDRTKGGLGLGLALVKGLVELHGGEVTAHSEGLGKGAEFTVRLPLDSQPDAGLRLATPVAPRSRRRVLVIEDNIDAADSLREVLEFGDHDVAVAYNGPEGLSKAREFQPEVVLCDIGLPGMDGFEVARAFRKDDALKGAFLVALSGYAQPDDVQRAQEAGFEQHLAKPPSLEKLEALLGSHPKCA
jgi:two-component system CheB/CheR fusion protein